MSRTIIAVIFTTLLAPTVEAGTIIKLGFSTDSKPDIELVNGMLSTFDDGAGATQGDQNTEVTFLGALSGLTPPEGDRASFSIDDIALSGTPVVIGGTALQATVGGTFQLYDQSNNVLLQGTLGNGTLSGPVSSIATGGFLTTEFGEFTGGSLQSALSGQGLTMSTFSIALSNLNEGEGLTIDPETNGLKDFTADATANVGAQVPEPSSVVLGLLAMVLLLPGQRKTC